MQTVSLVQLNGKRLTVWLTDDVGESAIFSGVVRWDGSMLALDREANTAFEIQPEWYERIRQVADEESRKILLNADYYLRLCVGNLPAAADTTEYQPTGLKWPD